MTQVGMPAEKSFVNDKNVASARCEIWPDAEFPMNSFEKHILTQKKLKLKRAKCPVQALKVI